MNTIADYQGVILAAGKGTRMRPFSEHWPKPILPVLGKPLMVHQLDMMASLGVRDVVIVIGHLGHEVVRTLGDGSKFGLRLRYVEQEETLGIAHAVSRLEPHVDRPFFLFLGDIFFGTENFTAMVEPLASGRAQGVLACKREPDLAKIRRNFIVLNGPDGRVQRVIEKPRHPRTDLKGCGIYMFDLAFFDAVRRTPRTAMRNEYEITDAIQIFIDDGYRVESAEVVREDINVSFPPDLLELNLRMLDRLGQQNWFGKSVEVEPGALLERTVVMDGASIEAGTALTECLLFPGAKVQSGKVAHRTIFTAESEIRCGATDLS
ncbi:MAG: sugar phosphate nucleotidyltransferase [Planctomycetota bacterium]